MSKKTGKKVGIAVLAAIIGAVSFMSLSGCKLDEQQVTAIASPAGTAAAVSWIAVDNPDAETKAIVVGVVDLLSSNLTSVTTGRTYSEVLYPVVEEYADAELEAQYRPLAKTGAIFLLNGVDTFFVLYPEWVVKQDVAIRVSSSFLQGARVGLQMRSADLLATAESNAARRAEALK